MSMRDILDTFGIPAHGIVYAGAHRGEHVDAFVAAGFTSILAVEPNPELHAHLAALPVIVVPAALGERDGSADYYAARGEQSLRNAIYPPHFAGVSFVKSRVPCVTLEQLLAEQPGRYNALYMNVQGAELAALRGAGERLADFDIVACEVNFVARYEDAALYPAVAAYLVEHGLREVGLWRAPEGDYGMASYVHARYLSSDTASPAAR
ncbi:MAG: FkbM family methyltransferase [Myxococcales bacterium]|nr:FkbM family methyltransferase [Myxococcales bacterium]